MKVTPRSPATVLLVMLLAADVLLIVGHILFLTTSFVQDINYSILTERGFGETFQYLKSFWLVLLFGWLVLLTREKGYLAWAAVFGYLGLDDLQEIHEEIGNDLAVRYEFTEFLGQRPRDLGEMIIFGVAGAVLLSLLAIAYWRGSETFRRRSKTLVKLSALLVFFGIGVDAVHILFLESAGDDPLGAIEDGGEMIALSVVCWYTFRLLVPQVNPARSAENGRVYKKAAQRRSTNRSRQATPR